MSGELLFEAIGAADEADLEASELSSVKQGRLKNIRLVKFGAIAAGICLAAGGAALIPNIGGILSNLGGSYSSGGISGVSSVFMSYAGPVFPLSLLEADGEITAERDITFDFEPWIGSRNSDGGYNSYSTDITVLDEYTLRNPANEDKTVTALYPFAGRISSLEKLLPELTVNSVPAEVKLYFGSTASAEAKSWEDYSALLSDSSYPERAMNRFSDLTGIPVTVYKFTDAYANDAFAAPNPTVRIDFKLDREKTKTLVCGFNGASFGSETEARCFSIDKPTSPNHGEPKYLIVLGEDISDITTSFYASGGFGKTERLPAGSAGVTAERFETELDTILREVVRSFYGSYNGENTLMLEFEEYYALFCEYLERNGELLPDAQIRSDGMLELQDVAFLIRVMYLSAEVTVPAGGSVKLAFSMNKEASCDFCCLNTQNRGLNGYDMVTKVGTNLRYTGLSASIEDHGVVDIVRQNFGFDIENNVKNVALDTESEHYFIEAKRKAET